MNLYVHEGLGPEPGAALALGKGKRDEFYNAISNVRLMQGIAIISARVSHSRADVLLLVSDVVVRAVLGCIGQASALEAESIGRGRDVGTVGVFATSVGEQDLTFSRSEAGFVDEPTGSQWNLAGEATAGPLAGTRLERIPHLDTFWFAWATYAPGTPLIDAP